jgi:hypothetical protein
VSRGGVDPIPLIFFLSLRSLSLFLVLQRLVTALLSRPRAHLPPPARLVLVSPLRVVLLQRMHVKTL